MAQTPSIGRIVHYTSRGSMDGIYQPEPRAAIITDIGQIAPDPDNPDDVANADCFPMVSLCVLNPDGMFFQQYVAHSEEPLSGCWSWPPRTAAVEDREVAGYSWDPKQTEKGNDVSLKTADESQTPFFADQSPRT